MTFKTARAACYTLCALMSAIMVSVEANSGLW